jgi:hypothetical protein
MKTLDKVKGIIRDSMEDTERADRFDVALSKYDGKPLTRPMVEKLVTETGERIRIHQIASMTSLIVGGYGDNGRACPHGLAMLASACVRHRSSGRDYFVNASVPVSTSEPSGTRTLQG